MYNEFFLSKCYTQYSTQTGNELHNMKTLLNPTGTEFCWEGGGCSVLFQIMDQISQLTVNKSVQMPWMEFLTLSRSDPARSNLVFRPDQFKSCRKTRLMPNGFFISFKGYLNDFKAHLSSVQ